MNKQLNSAMRLPDFLIIGAAKSGTTSLYEYLNRHPQIFLSRIKEPQFFAVDSQYERGIEWYSSLFKDASPEQICGEATTDYTKLPLYPKTPERIAHHLPNVKMIYIMRHPVERVYSHYKHLQRGQKVELTFKDYIQENHVCIDTSYYFKQINRYLDIFPKESFLFLLMEDLIHNPEQTLEQICKFIGVNEHISLALEEQVTANNSKRHFQDTIRNRITSPIRALPFVETIKDTVPQKWRDSAYNLLQNSFYGNQIKQQYLVPKMDDNTRQWLLDKFQGSNQELANFLNRDLSSWSL
ncbi:MAG: sulfotransferase family protein [Waterburya sp.]